MAREVERWILDYVCFKAWEEFQTNSVLSPRTVDFVSAVLGQNYHGMDIMLPKIYFMVVLCRMTDGEKLFVEYTDGQEKTVLEDMIPIFEKLVKCQTTSLQQEGLELIDSVVRTEAVLVCCRQKNYDLANEVYKRVWLQTSSKAKTSLSKMKTLLKDLIDPKKGDADELKDFTYSNFQHSMKSYLEDVQKTFCKPLLIKTAEKFQNRIEKHRDELKGKGYANKFTKDDLEKTKVTEEKTKDSDKDKTVTRSKETLRKLWNNNIKEMFGTRSPEESETPVRAKRQSVSALEEDTPPQKKKKSTPQVDLPTSSSSTPQQTSSSSTPQHKSTTHVKQSPQKVSSTNNVFRKPPSKHTSDESESSPSPSKRSPPRPVYRKNQGRQNRHDPAPYVANDMGDDGDSSGDSSFLARSVISVSSRKKWDEQEMDEFFDAVKIFGVGQWAKIKDHLGTRRSNVMLKDKWRNMLKSGDLQKIKERRKSNKKKM